MKKEETVVKQNMLVLKHLQKKSGITSWDAIENYGITRLSARIYDLRNNGFDIQDKWIEEYNRYGKKIKFKKYFLVK